MINNWFLWKYITSKKLSSSARVENKKFVALSVVFAISFLYRAIFNNIR
jgi:hypothetical protein